MAVKFAINNDGVCTLSDGCVKPNTYSTRTGDETPLVVQRHLHIKGSNFGCKIGDTPTTAEYEIHRAEGPGTVLRFHAALKVDGSSTSITYILKKNGSAITTTITLVDSTGDGVAVDATVSTPNYVAGDVFTILQTVGSSTGAQGPFSQAKFDELLA